MSGPGGARRGPSATLLTRAPSGGRTLAILKSSEAAKSPTCKCLGKGGLMRAGREGHRRSSGATRFWPRLSTLPVRRGLRGGKGSESGVPA